MMHVRCDGQLPPAARHVLTLTCGVDSTRVLLITHLSRLHRCSPTPLCHRSAADTMQHSSLSLVAFLFAAATGTTIK